MALCADMIATKVPSVYVVMLPAEVRLLLERLSFFASFNVQGLATTPLECLGLGGYVAGLLFWMVVPVVLATCILIGGLAASALEAYREARPVAEAAVTLSTRRLTLAPDHSPSRRLFRILSRKPKEQTRQREHVVSRRSFYVEATSDGSAGKVTLLQRCLPPFLSVVFLFYPVISNVAFDGFACYEFDNGRGWLIADPNIECHTPEHDQAKSIAWLAVAIYPVGLVVLNALLLWRARHAIVDGVKTPLSRSIGVIYKEYTPACFWWELCEMLRRFLLVGLFVVVEPGRITQTALGAIVCAVFLMIQLQAQPFRQRTDNYLALSSSFGLLMLFFCSILYKYAALTSHRQLQLHMSEEQRTVYLVPSVLLSAILVVSVLSALVAAGVLASVQAVLELRALQKLRRLKYRETKRWVELEPFGDPQAYHLFLSQYALRGSRTLDQQHRHVL